MPKQVTNHDYLGVIISRDLNWLRQLNKIQIWLAEPLVYLKEPYPPAHKMGNLLPTRCLFTPNLNMQVKSVTHIQSNVSRKFIFQKYRTDTDTSVEINSLNLDSLYSSFGVHPLRMTTSSSSTLNVGLAVAEEANA